eukprot:Sdes_comp20646_c0_seq2m15891
MGEEAKANGEGQALSKNALKKLEKEKEKAAKKEAYKNTKINVTENETGNEAENDTESDTSEGKYGKSPLIQSQIRTNRQWTDIGLLNSKDLQNGTIPKQVLIRVRIHTCRGASKNCFLVLRQRTHTLQGIISVDPSRKISKQMVKFCKNINKESLVDIEGEVVPASVASCTQGDVEIRINSIFIISEADVALPLSLDDAIRSDADILKYEKETGQKLVRVNQDTRLDNRTIDLRTTTNQAIFMLQSAVCQLFRENLISKGFMEIHSPKIIGAASEGGANVFRLLYFKTTAYLAQSPQLYKQMVISSDFDRVFEIGPVFR